MRSRGKVEKFSHFLLLNSSLTCSKILYFIENQKLSHFSKPVYKLKLFLVVQKLYIILQSLENDEKTSSQRKGLKYETRFFFHPSNVPLFFNEWKYRNRKMVQEILFPWTLFLPFSVFICDVSVELSYFLSFTHFSFFSPFVLKFSPYFFSFDSPFLFRQIFNFCS